ncbi:rhodanese-like domain-containing protein [Aliikangiella coralliicola]|uniref:Rhodanese-like domain-containing protein n=1 Tax=Aliikangiella coralliicola TaxID=2592383 RepID=A0A545UHC4_9GAMM|nr:rhodanese-like domain-containing protein [Aliikangiella coralliicola]TQV88867.1 rhodanese-like domain-containing protein [Aliikangiella coralliicola]
MNDFIQFAINHWELSGAWLVVAILLLSLQIKIMAHGPKSVTTQMLTNYVNRDDAVVVDIRGQADFNKGHIQGAVNVPLSKIKESAKDLEKYKDRPIIMVCANGIQVSGACQTLQKAGFERLHKLTGGMASWVGDNLPVVKS